MQLDFLMLNSMLQAGKGGEALGAQAFQGEELEAASLGPGPGQRLRSEAAGRRGHEVRAL